MSWAGSLLIELRSAIVVSESRNTSIGLLTSTCTCMYMYMYIYMYMYVYMYTVYHHTSSILVNHAHTHTHSQDDQQENMAIHMYMYTHVDVHVHVYTLRSSVTTKAVADRKRSCLMNQVVQRTHCCRPIINIDSLIRVSFSNTTSWDR